MSEHFLGKHYSWFVNSLLFLFPIGINTVKGTGDLILVTLAISGIVLSIFYKTSPFSIKELKLFNWLTLSYFVVICISILFSGKVLELAHFISRELYFLFAPFVALAIYQAKIKLPVLLYGVKTGLIVLAILVYVNVGSFDIRYSGSMNATAYGNIIGAMLLLSLVTIMKEKFIERVFTIISFVLGILALIASGTRGAWIGTILTLFIFILIAYKKGELKHLLTVLVVVISTFFILSSFTKLSNMENRVLLAKQQVINWISGEDVNSSVSIRMEMWNASLKQAGDRLPLTGFGYRNINPIIAKHADKQSQAQISQYNHVHNTYLNHLISEGVPGLIAILALLFIPLWKFICSIVKNKENSSDAASMGVMIAASFSLFGLSNNLFGDVFINAFYVFFLAILLPLIAQESIKKQTKGFFE